MPPAVAGRSRGGLQPATVSWSVTLSTVTPAAAARATSSAGVHRPSDAVVWVCRSINAAPLAAAGFPSGCRL